jgi:acyl-CoA hydrolase
MMSDTGYGTRKEQAVRSGARRITLRFLALPTDAGYSGNVDGGRVLEWIDKAAYACAVGWSGRYCVTAYVGNVRFSRPVHIGDLVETTAMIVHTGRTSMQVLVTVESGNPTAGILTITTECLVTFVALADDSRPTSVPEWVPLDAEDRSRHANAMRRIRLRADVEAAMATQRYTEDGTAPKIVLRFLAAPTDINWGGKVHGGIVMRWIDEAAHVLATSWMGDTKNIAVYAGGIRFYRPLFIGDLVEVEARLMHTGRSSMHISVHVRSGAIPSEFLQTTTHCLIIFVSLDSQGRASNARIWKPRSTEDYALNDHARHLLMLHEAVDR